MSEKEEKEKILDYIVADIKTRVPSDLQEAAATFVQAYYANVSLEDLSEIPLEVLGASVYDMWTFALTRPPKKPKIHIYTKKKEAKDQLLPQTIVEIVNDDMPFLVDSVTGVINSLGYSINLVIHPVMQVERDGAYALKKVWGRSQNKQEGTFESFIHCEILDALSPDKKNTLTQELLRALEDVRAAVEDWAPMRGRLQSVIQNLKETAPSIPKEELEEILFFLEWIEDNHFTFLGFCEYALIPGDTTIKRTLVAQEGLGILKDPLKQEITHIFGGVELTPVNRRYIIEQDPLIITKTTQVSLVHRRDPMDSITIKQFDKSGKVIGLYQFIGLFTSVAYNKSVRDIPLLRRKVSHVLEQSGFSEQWHDGKTLLHILESFPRDELFQASEEWLFETSMAVLQLQNRQRLTLFVRPDKFERFISCIVYIPRERYDSELRRKIERILEKSFDGELTNWQTKMGELAFARVHYTIKRLHKTPISYDKKAIEHELIEASLTWRDHLYDALLLSSGEKEGARLFDYYGQGFTKGYQERFTANEAITDIFEIEQAFTRKRLRASLTRASGQDENLLKFKIYSTEGSVSLSDILPVLDNMSLKVLSEIPFIITLGDQRTVWMHDFDIQTDEKDIVDLDHIRTHFLEGFSRIWCGKVENDGFNRLIVRANFSWRECQLIRAYAKYIRQLAVTFSQAYMEDTLAKHPLMSRLLIQLFSCQFSPEFKENRDRGREEVLNKIKTFLNSVTILDEDRILSKFVNAITSTLRTNYYQLQNGKPKPYVSFKINCALIDEMPLPRPKYEIFVFSPRVEAIHLRGGKVARGGIRWSDRKEDFRTEILGLMKAQMVKNAVIVPVGSKGGFIVKKAPLKGTLEDEVIQCYQTMIRGLLDLTDNIKDHVVVPPPDVVCHDEDDPYLVVAADKGTSTFSDYANNMAVEYDFWLGDAFASGGSTGYDHKKMGITARGAWESVKRHFREMDIDANKEEITVVGIGDMSGDVFGNGMLQSRHLKLLAAFNHLHIFVDPSPDPEKSYEERKRLFDLPHSTWQDYDPALLSQGGGVFERRAKSINLTPQMKALFNIREDYVAPPDLIRALLKTSVDLMWFGGIGTYIKAKNETSLDVGDRINDALRINGLDVRAKVIAEGANLGVTQLGRIEYAKNGGRINTDAIDNSAGVDCSDHEVNIKILLNQVMLKNKLTFEKRNTLLHEMTDDVAQLVLKDNFWQPQAISLARCQGARLLDEQARLMRDLEEEGILNRALENLPDETEIVRRMADKQGLTRPELAVLLAYTKMSLNQQLLHSEVPDLAILRDKLASYFPTRLQKSYTHEIETHPLKRDITATLFTNSIVNRMGITFIHEVKRQADVDGAEVARAYLIVRELLDLALLWQEIEALEMVPATFQTGLMLDVYENVKRFTDWFLQYGDIHRDMETLLYNFKPGFNILSQELSGLLAPQQRQFYEKKHQEYEQAGLPSSLAGRLLALDPLVAAPDMITLSKDLSLDIKMIARVYFALGEQLGFDWLRRTALGLSGETHWQQRAANVFIEELYMNQRAITKKILTSNTPLDELFKKDGSLVKDILPMTAVESTLVDLMNATTVDFAMLTVMNRQFRMIV